MTPSKRTLTVGGLLALASFACTLPGLDSSPAPTPQSVPQTVLPDSQTSVVQTPRLFEELPVLEPYDDVSPHYAAMRPGFEADVDAFAGRSRAWVTLDLYADDNLGIVGTEFLHFVNETEVPLNEIVMRLVPNAVGFPNSETVGTVLVDGAKVEAAFSPDYSTMTVPLAAPLEPGQQALLEIDFTLILPDSHTQLGYGRIAYWEGQAALSSFIPMLSVYDAESGWWTGSLDGPGDPAYSPVMLYDLRLRVPASFQVASTGTIIEQTTTDNSLTTYHIVTGPVRDVAVATGPSFEVVSKVVNDVTVSVWSLPGSPTEDGYALNLAADAVAVFDRQFGAYPFHEMDVIEAAISAGGIEYPGLIYIASSAWHTDQSFFDIVIVHETAHQWWYSMVGNNQVTEPWLDEGLTEYAVQVYYRETGGAEAGDAVEAAYQSEVDWYLSERGSAMPIGLYAEQYADVQYRVFVYSGGALLFGQLEEEYGTAAMDAFLTSYYQQYRYQNVSNEAMGSAIERAFGPEARAFYDRWVYVGIGN